MGLAPYCGQPITHGQRWHAAHVVDGDPTRGYVIAHSWCNEAAKRK